MRLSALLRDGRLRLLAATACLGLSLSGCQTDGVYSAKHLKPLSAEMLALIEQKGMDKSSAILVRAFKEESELEIWKKDSNGRFALLKTYPICRWSGELGPKTREGDRQAPEGFYTITPAQMNPNSAYYLSFNLGYPNAYDRAHGRTGSQLMVHGDCSSRGCYSMTDEQIAEIFGLGRDAFFGGQRSFQVQAYPFRMTPLNMAKHRNSPHLAFWKMLKEGNDHFEVSRQEPKVDVCERRYVFNSKASGLQPTAACPALQVPPELTSEVSAKTKRDELAFADFVRRNTPTVAVKTGRDGGMHPVFLAKLKGTREQHESNGELRSYSGSEAPGTIPSHAVPPREAPTVAAADRAAPASVSAAGTVPTPSPAPRRTANRGGVSTTGAAAATAEPSGNFFSGLFSSSNDSVDKTTSSVARAFGFGAEEKPAPVTRPSRAPAAPPARTAAKPVKPPARPSSASTQTASAPSKRPASVSGAKTAEATPSRASAGNGAVVSGAQPVVPSGGFESRWPVAR